MSTTNELMNVLFQQHSQYKQSHLEQHLLLPNFTGGMDLRSINGDVLATYEPGVGLGDGTVLEAKGQPIAQVSENVQGGKVIDFGQGESISSIPNVYGGETYHSISEGVIGFTNPAFGGGMEFNIATGANVTAEYDPIRNGVSVSSSVTPPIPTDKWFDVEPIEEVSSEIELVDVVSGLDVGEGLDITDIIGAFNNV